MTKFTHSSLLVSVGLLVGAGLTVAGISLASPNAPVATASDRTYTVTINEIKKNFVFAKQFSGSYTQTVEMSDGSARTVTLRPVVMDGKELVELTDDMVGGPGYSYMGPNGTTTNGTLMVSVHDAAEARAALGFK